MCIVSAFPIYTCSYDRANKPSRNPYCCNKIYPVHKANGNIQDPHACARIPYPKSLKSTCDWVIKSSSTILLLWQLEPHSFHAGMSLVTKIITKPIVHLLALSPLLFISNSADRHSSLSASLFWAFYSCYHWFFSSDILQPFVIMISRKTHSVLFLW